MDRRFVTLESRRRRTILFGLGATALGTGCTLRAPTSCPDPPEPDTELWALVPDPGWRWALVGWDEFDPTMDATMDEAYGGDYEFGVISPTEYWLGLFRIADHLDADTIVGGETATPETVRIGLEFGPFGFVVQGPTRRRCVELLAGIPGMSSTCVERSLTSDDDLVSWAGSTVDA